MPDPEEGAPAPEAAPVETALAVREGVRHEVILALPPDQVKKSMQTHQELLHEILDRSDWQGDPSADGSFVKKSGWRKIALAYNLGMERVSEEVERDEEGTPLRASYTAAAIAPNGRRVASTGHCAASESRFARAGGRQKLENDMRATAETRAKNRAISDLIGMGKVSAEEVEAGAPDGPAFGPAAADADMVKAGNAIAYLCDRGDGPDAEAAEKVLATVTKDCGGYLPRSVARSFLWAAVELRERIEGPKPKAEPAPAAAPASTTMPGDGATPAAAANAAADAATAEHQAAKRQSAATPDPAIQADPDAPEVVDAEVVPDEPSPDEMDDPRTPEERAHDEQINF